MVKRKPGGQWGKTSLSKYAELNKKKLIHNSGKKAYLARNRIDAEDKIPPFSSAQMALFKKNKKGWEFFNSQAPSYRKYMVYWVNSAKRSETRSNRLSDLVRDSGEGTKLKRVLEAQQKVKPRYEEGQTPVEEGKNLGLITGAELRSVEILTLEQLKRTGWERAIEKVCAQYPHRLNLNFFYAVIGAVEEENWRKIDVDLKAQAKDLLAQLKR